VDLCTHTTPSTVNFSPEESGILPRRSKENMKLQEQEAIPKEKK
jgi:hypothetical protein